MLPRLSTAALTLSLLATTHLRAQTTDTARVQPVVITATRVPVSRASAPAAVSIVTGDELRQRGVTRIANVLEQLPGVALAQTGSFGGTTALFLRGGESKYVKVLVDGVPVNDPGGSFDFGTLTVDDVERVELVRGPASVLYGADAVTGVIQIFTRRGVGVPRVSTSFRAGTYDTRDANLSVAGRSGTADFSLGVARHTTDGIYAFNSDYANTVVSGALRYAPDDRTALALTLRYGDHAFHYPTTSSGAVVDSNAVRAEDRTVLGLDASRRLTSAVTAHLALASHLVTGGTDDRPQANIQSTFVSIDDIRRRGANAWVDIRLPTAATLTLGAQAEQQDQRSQSQSESGGFVFNDEFRASRTNRAAYAELLTGLGSTALVTAGFRHDDNERFGGFTTYRLGASWRMLADTRLRATIGTAFREPTFYENYATGFVTGNRDLAPERTTSWDAGIEQSLSDRLTIGATWFDQRFRDMIDYTGTTEACGASYCNVARARARGAELEARARIAAGLSADAAFTHLETKVLRPGFDQTSGGLYREGESLIRRPTTTWTAGATLARSRGTLDLRLTHVGDRSDRDYSAFPALPVVLDAYTKLDAGAELVVVPATSGRGSWSLTLRAENLGDASYQSVYGFLTPGRTLLIGARADF